MDCPNLEVDYTDCYRAGQHHQETFYTCQITGEECTLYYEDYCNNKED